MKSPLPKLLGGKDLRKGEARAAFLALFRGKMDAAHAKALLLLLAQKGESVGEILGCLEAVRRVERPRRLSLRGLMDTCGTGGDGSQSFNVSTLAALVIAGAGGRVAKHGNRSLSSRCGSSDLMEALGVKLDAGPQKMIQSLRRFGIGYFHAPYYHPVFSRLQPLRRRLKARTIFNFLGPLLNPMAIEGQLVGVAKPEWVRLYAQALARQNLKRAAVCHSRDGMDELSTACPSRVAWITKKKIRFETLDPRRLGFPRPRTPKAFRGGSARHNRFLALDILQGRLRGPLRDIVVLNAAMGLVVAGMAQTVREGIALAKNALDSGSAYRALLGLRKISQTG